MQHQLINVSSISPLTPTPASFVVENKKYCDRTYEKRTIIVKVNNHDNQK